MSLTNSPKLESTNLILRGPEIRDFEPIAHFYADAPRAAGFGGSLKRDEAWRWFASNIGHWHIHGYGYFTIETKTGEIAGISGIWNPEGWPEPEVGWLSMLVLKDAALPMRPLLERDNGHMKGFL